MLNGIGVSNKCQNAFKINKKTFTKNNVLKPYDPKLDMVVTCDIANYGVDVLSLVSYQLVRNVRSLLRAAL